MNIIEPKARIINPIHNTAMVTMHEPKIIIKIQSIKVRSSK